MGLWSATMKGPSRDRRNNCHQRRLRHKGKFFHQLSKPLDFNSPISVVYVECHEESLCVLHSKKEALITAGHIPSIHFANLYFLPCQNSFDKHKRENGLKQKKQIRSSLSTISLKQEELTSIVMLSIEVPAQQKMTNLQCGQNEDGHIFQLHAEGKTFKLWFKLQ